MRKSSEAHAASTRQGARWRAERHRAPASGHPLSRRCDRCDAWFEPAETAASSPLRSCSDTHRLAGILRGRRGRSSDALPDASPTELRRGAGGQRDRGAEVAHA